MTALAATFQRASGTRPPRVLLQVTGAPNPPAGGYTANFTASADSWTGSGTGVSPLWLSGDTFLRLESSLATGTVGNVITASRVVTGLTVAAVYKVRVTVTRSSPNAGTTRVRVTGSTTGSYTAVPVGANTVLEITFTATATSHTINVDQQRAVTFEAERVYILAATVLPTGTWQGTTIRRTDVNGANVTVREDQGGMDTAGGTMTLYDLEAAIVGPIVYAVTDGNGVVTYATTTASSSPRVNYVPNPGLELNVTGWQAQGTGTTFTRTTTDADTGQACGLLATGTVNGLALRTNLIVLDNPVGKTYAIRLRVKATVSHDVSPALRFVQADGATTTTTFTGATVTLAAGVWTTLTLTAVAPALTTQARVQLNKLDTTARTLLVDSVVLQEVPAGTTFDPAAYFDGSTAGGVWFGTAHNSPSMVTTLDETDAGVWLTTPALALPSEGTVAGVPLALVLNYEETSESNGSLHDIIGRADPIANPGPLTLRTGSLELFCTDYPTAKAIRALLATGEVAQMRQPTYAGADLYFVAQDVRIQPAPEDTDPRRWVATLSYAEVLAA